jgi:hypothetical protein
MLSWCARSAEDNRIRGNEVPSQTGPKRCGVPDWFGGRAPLFDRN